MRSVKKKSFRRRLLASYLLVTFISLSIFAAVFFILTLREMRENQFYALKNGAHAIVNTVDSYMDSINTLISSIHADSTVQSYLRGEPSSITRNEAHSAIIMQDTFTRRASSIQVFSSSHHELPVYKSTTQYDRAIFSNADVKDMDWYRLTEESGGSTCWFYEEQGSLDKKPCFYACRLIRNTHKPLQQMGVIRVCVAQSIIESLLDMSFYSDGDVMLVINDEPILTTMENTGNAETLKEIIGQKGSTELLHNRDYYAVAVDTKYDGWTVYVLLHNEIFLRKQIAYLFPVLAIWATMFLVTFIYSGRQSAYLARPVRNLYDKIIQFGDANDIFVDEESGEEISYLYKAFNMMVRKIDTLVQRERENEVRMLQSQINPHFVYNTLESLRAMASIKGETDLADMIATFGAYFRKCLNDGHFYSTIEHELGHVVDYLEIQHLRYPTLFSWSVDVPGSIRNYYLPHAVLQPLVENAIMHGFEDMTEGGMIRIEGCEADGGIRLTVTDNGCGMDIDRINEILHSEKENGFSCIRNIWQRLKRFSAKADFHYEFSDEGGLTAILFFEKKDSMPERPA